MKKVMVEVEMPEGDKCWDSSPKGLCTFRSSFYCNLLKVSNNEYEKLPNCPARDKVD